MGDLIGHLDDIIREYGSWDNYMAATEKTNNKTTNMETAQVNANGKAVTITLTEEQIRQINNATLDITDRVKTFEDACAVLGYDPDNHIPYDGDNSFEVGVNAYAKIVIIARALNEGWEPNWDDSTQFKFYPFFDLRGPAGFAYDGWALTDARTNVGSRLCFKTKTLAEYAGKQFANIYKDLMTL